MKKNLLLLILIFAATVASARPISVSEARGIAASRLGTVESALRMSAPSATTAAGDAPVYVFNAASAGGFIIIAGDDRMPSLVLGYSDSGSIDLSDCPPAMRAWLDGIAAFIAAGDFSRVSRSDLDYSSPVAPLLTTKWDQGTPFNLLTPASPSGSGENCPTGCVATAMAQVLNYWEYPKNGGLCEHSYSCRGQTLSVDFRQSIYDWDNMADIYETGATTEAQDRAVAKLMWDCGVSVNMVYDDDSSGAFDYDAAWAMVNIFGFSKAVRLRTRDMIADSEWFAIVKGELDAARPVLYLGSTVNSEGHAFVCDGYDAQGLYHINWGWGGKSDGYFDLNTLDPEAQGIGGAGSGEGFSQSQSIITGVQPPVEGEEPAIGWEMATYAFYVTPLDTDGSTFDLTCLFANLGYTPFEGSIVGYCHKQGEGRPAEGFLIGERTGDDAIKPSTMYKATLSELKASEFTDGVWELEFTVISSGDTEMDIPTHANCAALQFEIKDGKLLFDSRPQLEIEDFAVEELDYYITANDGTRCKYVNATFNVSNNSGISYNNGYTIKVRYPNGVLMDYSNYTFYIYTADPVGPGETIQVEYPIFFNVEGDVEVEIDECTTPGNTELNPFFNGNILTLTSQDIFHELSFVDDDEDPVVTESDGRVTISVEAYSCTGNPASSDIDEEYQIEREVVCAIVYPATTEVIATTPAVYSGQWHEAVTLNFAPDIVLPNGQYLAMFVYTSAPNILGQTLDLYLGMENDYQGYPFQVTTSGISSIIPDASSAPEAIYTLSGLRLPDGAVLAPGIYIKRSGTTVSKIFVK